ncbi:unnamed protein product [Porites evermanni]|uniref:Histidinol-phosphatase n=1 Tax=Porites evermanni TaxID=104178 RepID=A0ABN8LXK9_9CNID|nr:unnamed protein product [Porites evermanni]
MARNAKTWSESARYAPPEEIVLRAIEVGFIHYGLSEHMPRYEPEDLYEEEIEKDVLPQTLSSSKIIVLPLPEYLPAESVRMATTRDLRGNSKPLGRRS